MAELSQRSGTPVPTIKYYIREGILAPGVRTATNQADYSADHVARIELIRALRDVAALPIATIKETLHAIEHPPPNGGGPDHMTVAFGALSPPPRVPAGEAGDYARAATKVDAVLEQLGWKASRASGSRHELIRAVVAIDRHFPGGVSPDVLRRYAQTAQHLAEREIPETWDPAGAPTDALRYAVLGTVLFEPVILALRRLAHVDRHHQLRAARSA